MRKLLLFLIIFFVCESAVLAQGCLPGGITFSTQSDIDNFQVNFPNCHEIEGDVSITGNGITNLVGLNTLSKIDGDLHIYSNDSLPNLLGLNNITSILGSVTMSNNSLLTNLTGLNNLATVGGDWIILYHPNLIDFTGLDSLKVINGELQIIINYALTSLSGLEYLHLINGNLFIYGNSNLISLSGLIALNTIGGNLTVNSNPNLTTLAGLDSISSGSIINLAISENPKLTTCALTSICNYLSSPNGTINIFGNSTGCNTQSEIEEACKVLSISNPLLEPTLELYPNPCTGYFTVMSSWDLQMNEITIFNNIGQLLNNWKFSKNNVDATQFERGFYNIIIRKGNNTFRRKLVVL